MAELDWGGALTTAYADLHGHEFGAISDPHDASESGIEAVPSGPESLFGWDREEFGDDAFEAFLSGVGPPLPVPTPTGGTGPTNSNHESF